MFAKAAGAKKGETVSMDRIVFTAALKIIRIEEVKKRDEKTY